MPILLTLCFAFALLESLAKEFESERNVCRYLGMGLESFYLFRLDEEYVVRAIDVTADRGCLVFMMASPFLKKGRCFLWFFYSSVTVRIGWRHNEGQQREVHKPQVRIRDVLLSNFRALRSCRKAFLFRIVFSCNGNTVVKIIKAGGSSSGMRKCITFYSIRVIEIGAACDLITLHDLHIVNGWEREITDFHVE